MTKVASELRDSGSGLSSVQPPASLQPRPNNIDFTADGEVTEAGQLCVTQAGTADSVECGQCRVLVCCRRTWSPRWRWTRCWSAATARRSSATSHTSRDTSPAWSRSGVMMVMMMMMVMIMMMMEQVCRDNFEKSCQISFRPEVSRETVTNESRASGHVTQYSPPIGQVRRESVRVCSRPLLRTCNGQGPEVCTVQYETSCTTRYSDTRAWSSSSYNQHVTLTCVQAS